MKAARKSKEVQVPLFEKVSIPITKDDLLKVALKRISHYFDLALYANYDKSFRLVSANSVMVTFGYEFDLDEKILKAHLARCIFTFEKVSRN